MLSPFWEKAFFYVFVMLRISFFSTKSAAVLGKIIRPLNMSERFHTAGRLNAEPAAAHKQKNIL